MDEALYDGAAIREAAFAKRAAVLLDRMALALGAGIQPAHEEWLHKAIKDELLDVQLRTWNVAVAVSMGGTRAFRS